MGMVARPFALALVILVTLAIARIGHAVAREPELTRLSRIPCYLMGDLSDEQQIQLSAALATHPQEPVLLLDSAVQLPYLKAFLHTCQPSQITLVGHFREGPGGARKRLGVGKVSLLKGQRSNRTASRGQQGLYPWPALYRQAPRVVLCPPTPRSQLLQAACLAGVLRAPLCVVQPGEVTTRKMRTQFRRWRTRRVYLVGSACRLAPQLSGLSITHLRSERKVQRRHLRELVRTKSLSLRSQPVRRLVITNPADGAREAVPLSTLAPWVALKKRAALVFTNRPGTNAKRVVEQAMSQPKLRTVDTLILLADLKSVPVSRRPNLMPGGKDRTIEMEPTTPPPGRPYRFAVGRLFHDDPAVVYLMLARQRLLNKEAKKVLLASNSGSSLPLLEALSRCTAMELANAGYRVTPLFRHAVQGDRVRELLPQHDIFLWEGHHNTLIKNYGMPSWEEPLRPSLMVLQSCLMLRQEKALPLLRRGALGVVGLSSRTYSATGGAFSLAFFNALLEEQPTSVGGALRQAKNFLLLYAMLKEKRLGEEARRSGATRCAAWAFSLWGDPTIAWPRPARPRSALARVRHRIRVNHLIVEGPTRCYPLLASGRYRVRLAPGSRLGGLIQPEDSGVRQLVPMTFVEFALPEARSGDEPILRSQLSSRRWVFLWDEHRRVGYLLIAIQPDETQVSSGKDSLGGPFRFRIHWRKKNQGLRGQLLP